MNKTGLVSFGVHLLGQAGLHSLVSRLGSSSAWFLVVYFWLVFFAVLWDFLAIDDGYYLSRLPLRSGTFRPGDLLLSKQKDNENTLLPRFGQVVFSLFLQPVAVCFGLIQVQATFWRC